MRLSVRIVVYCFVGCRWKLRMRLCNRRGGGLGMVYESRARRKSCAIFDRGAWRTSNLNINLDFREWMSTAGAQPRK
jgi:hypothetical protein